MQVEKWHLRDIVTMDPQEAMRMAAESDPGSVFATWTCTIHGGHMVVMTSEHLADLQGTAEVPKALAELGSFVFHRTLDDDPEPE